MPIVLSIEGRRQFSAEGKCSVQVGRYQVLETIGTGANSRVVRGFDPMINRTVAIKLFSPALASGAGRDKFLTEARVVGQITHASIIALHDMGIEESTRTPYLVMEYVEGQSLERILEKGSVPFPRACAWTADIAVALSVAHRKGVIHGDVKTANILINQEGRVKLTDFGMARLASNDTKDTPLVGTPAYWCPEQILGKPQDSRSDIFSLGVILYEMITGTRPFKADSLQGMCSLIMSSTPLPPSHSNPSLPAGLNDLVSSCLAKDPAHRRSSAEDLADDLYPFARRKALPQTASPTGTSSFRDRAAKLLRSA